MSIDSSSSKKKMKQKVCLILLSLLAIFLFLEIGLRGYDLIKGRGFFSKHRKWGQLRIFKSKDIKRRPFRTYGVDLYKEIDGIQYISSTHGELYPLNKSKDTFRIVCFGGSTTQNENCFQRYGVHYPLLLQSMLRERTKNDEIEVINVGYLSYSTAHSLILFELDVLSWNPDLIILSHNINDLTVAYFPNFSFDYSNKYSHKFYNFSDASEVTSIDALFQHFQVYWFLKKRINRLWNRPSLSIKRKSMNNKLNSKALAVFERNLRSFVTLAKSFGIQVLLATQPLNSREDLFSKQMEYQPYNDIVIYPMHDEFVKHHGIFNKIIEKVANSNNVWFLDNKLKYGDNDEYFIDFTHYTREGVYILANNFAQFLLAKNWHISD